MNATVNSHQYKRRGGKPRRNEVDIFMSKISMGKNGCWNWLGYVQNAGYGSISFANGTKLVHRWSFEYVMGIQIPDGMTLDHLCKNKLCANPLHMEVVTRKENILRAGLNGFAKLEANKTQCPKGHEYSKYGRKVKNGFKKDGSVKYARRCSVCYPNHK